MSRIELCVLVLISEVWSFGEKIRMMVGDLPDISKGGRKIDGEGTAEKRRGFEVHDRKLLEALLDGMFFWW